MNISYMEIKVEKFLGKIGGLRNLQRLIWDDLNKPKQMDISKQSIFGEDDEKKLRELLQERDKTIRRLSKRIAKLQSNGGRPGGKGFASQSGLNSNSGEKNYFQQVLQQEAEKYRKLQQVVRQICRRVNVILSDLAQDNSFTENSEELRQMLEQIDIHNFTVSQAYAHDQEQSLSISEEWMKMMDILEGAVRSYKQRCVAFKNQAKMLQDKLQASMKQIQQLTIKLNDGDQIRVLKYEIKEQRKQKEKLKGLLQKTEVQKNDLINRINMIGLKDPQIKAKSKEQLLQYSLQLNYRIKDLQKQKEDIIKESTKDKALQIKKYQDVLRKLKNIKQTSRLGKSFA